MIDEVSYNIAHFLLYNHSGDADACTREKRMEPKNSHDDHFQCIPHNIISALDIWGAITIEEMDAVMFGCADPFSTWELVVRHCSPSFQASCLIPWRGWNYLSLCVLLFIVAGHEISIIISFCFDAHFALILILLAEGWSSRFTISCKWRSNSLSLVTRHPDARHGFPVSLLSI